MINYRRKRSGPVRYTLSTVSCVRDIQIGNLCAQDARYDERSSNDALEPNTRNIAGPSTRSTNSFPTNTFHLSARTSSLGLRQIRQIRQDIKNNSSATERTLPRITVRVLYGSPCSHARASNSKVRTIIRKIESMEQSDGVYHGGCDIVSHPYRLVRSTSPPAPRPISPPPTLPDLQSLSSNEQLSPTANLKPAGSSDDSMTPIISNDAIVTVVSGLSSSSLSNEQKDIRSDCDRNGPSRNPRGEISRPETEKLRKLSLDVDRTCLKLLRELSLFNHRLGPKSNPSLFILWHELDQRGNELSLRSHEARYWCYFREQWSELVHGRNISKTNVADMVEQYHRSIPRDICLAFLHSWRMVMNQYYVLGKYQNKYRHIVPKLRHKRHINTVYPMREKFQTLRLALYDFFFAANLNSFGQLKASWNGISSFVRHEKSWIYRTPFSFRLLKLYAKSCEAFKGLKITMHLLQLDAKDSLGKWNIILGGSLRQYLVAGSPEKEPGEKTGSNSLSQILPKLGNTSKTPGQPDTPTRFTYADRHKEGQPSPQLTRGIRSSPTCATKEWREHEPRTRRKEQYGRQRADTRRIYERAMMSRLDDQCSSVCRSTVKIANQLHPTNPLGNRLWDVRDELLFSCRHIEILVHRARYLAYLRGQLHRPHPWIHPTSRKQDHVLAYPADPEISLRRQIQQDLHITRSDIRMYCMLIHRFYKRRGVEWRVVGMVAQTQHLFPNPDFIANEDFHDDPKVNSVLIATLLTHRSLHNLQSIVANFVRLRILSRKYYYNFTQQLKDLEDSLISFDLFIWRRALASQHPRNGGSVKDRLNKFKQETLPDGKTMKRDSRPSGFDRHGPLRSWLSSPSTRRRHLTENASRDVRLSRPKRAAFHTSTKASGSSSTHNEGIATVDRSRSGEGGPSENSDMLRQQLSGPLGYYVRSDNMRQSMLASRSSRSAYWQYTLYEGPEGQKVKVHYCKSLETTERIARLFLKESVIGFDIEWKPSATIKDGIRKNVALIQLASEERIALFHIARFSKGDEIASLVAPTFKAIMESSSITKVGVSVKGDGTRLRKYMNIDSRGLCELSYLYKLVKFSLTDVKKINRSLIALAKQVEEHLMLPMSKDDDVRGSDWSEDLNYQQISCRFCDSLTFILI